MSIIYFSASNCHDYLVCSPLEKGFLNYYRNKRIFIDYDCLGVTVYIVYDRWLSNYSKDFMGVDSCNELLSVFLEDS